MSDPLIPRSSSLVLDPSLAPRYSPLATDLFACLRSNRVAREPLEQLAADFTPRYERQSENVLMLDISGLGRVIGPPRVVGEEIRRVGADRGLYVSVAIASTRTAARLMVEARAGVSLIKPQQEAKALSPLPITLLTVLVESNTACVGVDAARTPFGAGRHVSLDRVRTGWRAEGDAACVTRTGSETREATVDGGGSRLRLRGTARLSAVRQKARRDGTSRHYRMAPSPDLPEPADVHGRGTAHLDPQSDGDAGYGTQPPPCPDLEDALDTLRRWGIKTLGELAALPAAALFERLGSLGLTLQSWARGEDGRPLVRAMPIPQFVETLELEWPIDTLEPLSFVLSRLFEPLCHRLEQHDLAAAVVRVHLTLVSREQIERTLQLPAPMRDPKVLRTLVLLDLEARPPHAGIDRVTLEIEPALGRIVQHSLLVRALPAPEQLSTLVARLTALLGEGRCGAPALLDTHRSSAFTMSPFHPAELAHRSPSYQQGTPSQLALVLRRLRNPIAVRVTCEKGRPMRVASGRRGLGGGRIVQASGPWRTSGEWWSVAVRDRIEDAVAWDHDEWDVELGDGRLWRLAYARDLDRWLMHGQYD